MAKFAETAREVVADGFYSNPIEGLKHWIISLSCERKYILEIRELTDDQILWLKNEGFEVQKTRFCYTISWFPNSSVENLHAH